MAYGLDAGDILSSYMQGADFVARGMQRAEERAKQQQKERIESMTAKAMTLFEPQFVDGKLVPRSMTDIMKTPEFVEMANSPEFQSVLMQGVTDPAVKGVRYVGAAPDPQNPQDHSRGVPMLQHIGEDGQPLGPPGPLTTGRSRDGNDAVASFTPDMAFRHLAGVAYSVDPALGQNVLNRIHQSNVNSLRMLAKNATSQEELNGIFEEAAKTGISPKDLMSEAGRPYVTEESNGITKTHDPLTGGIRVGYDPKIQKQVTAPAAVGSAKANDAAKEAVFANEQIREDKDQRRTAATSNDLANQFNEDAIARDETRQRNQGATSNDLANRFHPDVIKRNSDSTEAQHATTQRLTQQDNQAITQAVAGLDSSDPNVRNEAQQGLLKYFKSPEDARTYVRKSQAETNLKDLRSALGKTPDEAYRNVAKDLAYTDDATQRRVFTELTAQANDPDPAVREIAQAGLRAASATIKGPQQGKSPDPGEFNASMADPYMQSLGYKKDTPEYQSMRAGATEAFNRLRKALPGEITKGSQAETYANIAAVKAHDLAQQGMPNAEKPMFIHSELEDLGYRVKDFGSTKDFVKEIYNPLGDALNKAGVPEADDATARRIGTELVVGLKQNGVNTGVAVNEVAKLFKDPRTYVNKLNASGGDLRSLATALATEIKKRPSALGQAFEKGGRLIDEASME